MLHFLSLELSDFDVRAAGLQERSQRMQSHDEDQPKDQWKSYVDSMHERNPFGMKMRRTRSESVLPKPAAFSGVKPWQHGMSRTRIPAPLRSSASELRLPAIRPLDKYSKLAFLQAQNEHQLRRTPPAFPMHLPPLLLAAEVRAHANEQQMQLQMRRTEKQLAASRLAAAAEADSYAALASDRAAVSAKERAEKKKNIKKTAFVMQVSEVVNAKFGNMFKAFQSMDLDRSGSLNEKELARALDLLNIPIDRPKLRELILCCDRDGDGQVDYKEFVDVLARDTVTLAAMGKRDMQALEAMGVADLDKEFLGHKTFKNVKATINESFDLAMARDEKEDPAASKVSSASMVKQASDSLNAKFTNMRKAFQDIDLDHSGSLSAEELWQAFDRLNLQLDRHNFKALITACDKDGNGNISYEEVSGPISDDPPRIPPRIAQPLACALFVPHGSTSTLGEARHTFCCSHILCTHA